MPEGTFAFVSQKAIADLHRQGFFVYDGITWRVVDQKDRLVHIRADIDQTEMWLQHEDGLGLYLVTEMRHNPLGIDWRITR